MKAIFIAGLGAALVASSTYAQQTQVVGQPVLRAPAPMAPEDLRSHPNFGQPATKLPRAARAPSTPESRSAAALALSADPVFDERARNVVAKSAGFAVALLGAHELSSLKRKT